MGYDFREKTFLDMAIEYKLEYESTKWWKFKKKQRAYNNWRGSLELMIKYSK